MIGFLGAGTSAAWSPWVTPFVHRLNELGWTEGRTVAIEFRWAEGRPERAAEITKEFIQLKIDVLVTSGALLLEAKQASSHFPTVLVLANDPVGSGFAQSLARPGGNVTGLSFQGADVASKRLELLREVVPDVRRLAVLMNKNNPGATLEIGEVEAAARILRVETVRVEYQRSEEIQIAVESLKGRVDAIYVIPDPLVNSNGVQIAKTALSGRLPTIHGFREPVVAGGLLSYGANFPDMFRRAAEYVDKVLRGAKPAELPIEQPNKFDLVINTKAAKALELKIPESLLVRADEVIE